MTKEIPDRRRRKSSRPADRIDKQTGANYPAPVHRFDSGLLIPIEKDGRCIAPTVFLCTDFTQRD